MTVYCSLVSSVLSWERANCFAQNERGILFRLIVPSLPVKPRLPLPLPAVLNWSSLGSAPGAN